jgi:hypothetical protein
LVGTFDPCTTALVQFLRRDGPHCASGFRGSIRCNYGGGSSWGSTRAFDRGGLIPLLACRKHHEDATEGHPPEPPCTGDG